MEAYQIMLNTVVGAIVVPMIVQFIKKHAAINLPFVKFLLVGLMSAVFAIIFAWLYNLPMEMKEVAIIGLNVGFAAIGGKTIMKSFKK